MAQVSVNSQLLVLVARSKASNPASQGMSTNLAIALSKTSIDINIRGLANEFLNPTKKDEVLGVL